MPAPMAPESYRRRTVGDGYARLRLAVPSLRDFRLTTTGRYASRRPPTLIMINKTDRFLELGRAVLAAG